MINRKTDISLVRAAIRRSRVVALLGPRQCGKTTLARQFVPEDSVNYFVKIKGTGSLLQFFETCNIEIDSERQCGHDGRATETVITR